MTKRLDVLLAIKAMIEVAVPEADVLGLENEGAPPDRIPAGGRIVIRAGDPGEPEITLSPVTYDYEHEIPVEVSANADPVRGLTAEQRVDEIVSLLGAAIMADRTLGGLVDYLDGFSPATEDLFTPGAAIARAADLALIAAYSTTDPL